MQLQWHHHALCCLGRLGCTTTPLPCDQCIGFQTHRTTGGRCTNGESLSVAVPGMKFDSVWLGLEWFTQEIVEHSKCFKMYPYTSIVIIYRIYRLIYHASWYVSNDVFSVQNRSSRFQNHNFLRAPASRPPDINVCCPFTAPAKPHPFLQFSFQRKRKSRHDQFACEG